MSNLEEKKDSTDTVKTQVGIEPATEKANPTDSKDDKTAKPTEIGGRKGPDPTRFGDWEKNGRCIDF